MDRDGTDKLTAAKEMESQLPLAEKVSKADYVIDNSGVLSDTNKQVKHLADLLNGNSEPRPA
jgi:dephospho-CoA kinase